MNGALFAAFRVILNLVNMLSCSRTTHGFIRQLGMTLYMIYFVTMQVLSFFMVGSFYFGIKLFYVDYFQQITDKSKFHESNPKLWQFFNGEQPFNFNNVFSWGYLGVLVVTVLVSLAVPIDRAMEYIRIITVLLAVLTVTSLFGIIIFLAEQGFFPAKRYYDFDKQEWVTDDSQHPFSIFTLCGVIMLSIYLVPVLFRPIDFISNLQHYLLGFVSYMLMLPVFINVMQVYSMSNLHDVSWGNRPSANAGTGQLTINNQKAQELKSNYMVYRVNFLIMWILSNLLFALLVENYATKSD